MAGGQLGQSPVVDIGGADHHAIEVLAQQRFVGVIEMCTETGGEGVAALCVVVGDTNQLHAGDCTQAGGVRLGVAVSRIQYADADHSDSSNVATSTGRVPASSNEVRKLPAGKAQLLSIWPIAPLAKRRVISA